MTEIQIAFQEWMNTFPGKRVVPKREITIVDRHGDQKMITEPAHFDGDCCSNTHFLPDGRPKPEHQLCAREKAWRAYVLARETFGLIPH